MPGTDGGMGRGKGTSSSNLKENKADSTVREVYFSNISKGTDFLLQGMFETDPVTGDVAI